MIDIDTRITTEGQLTHIERVQDCTPIAEYAKAQHNAGFHGSSELKHAARIPNVIIEKYCNDHNIEFSEFMRNREHMRRVLNDPSLAAFRIWPGKV
jgi:hypothetical protein